MAGADTSAEPPTTAGQAEDVRLSTAAAVTAVPTAAWNRLSAGLDIRLDRRWFALHESDIDAQVSYVTAWRGDDLLGIAPVFLSTPAEGRFASYRPADPLLHPEVIRGPTNDDDDRALAASARPLASLRRSVGFSVVAPYSPYAPVSELLWRPDSGNAGGLFDLLQRELEALADEHGVELWAILGVPDDSPLLRIAVAAGFIPILLSAEAVAVAPDTSVADYWRSGQWRAKWRRETRRAQERGIVISHEREPLALIDELAYLNVRERTRRGQHASLDGELEYFSEFHSCFAREWHVVTARREGRLIAFSSVLSSVLRHKSLEYAIEEESVTREDFLFPNLMYAVLEAAVERGGGDVLFGPMNYQAKVLRGCRLDRLWGLYNGAATSSTAFVEHARVLTEVNTSFFRELEPLGVGKSK
jgi:hypothetical protein